MKKVDKDKKYVCLKCNKEAPGHLLIRVYYRGQITAYKCPYCRGEVKEAEDNKGGK